jgi:hypothetical protein
VEAGGGRGHLGRGKGDGRADKGSEGEVEELHGIFMCCNSGDLFRFMSKRSRKAFFGIFFWYLSLLFLGILIGRWLMAGG